MASPAGNPNQPTPFDMQKFFKPPQNPNPNPNTGPFPPPTTYPAPPPSYPNPPPGPFSYPPQTNPFHHHPFLHYPQEALSNVHHNSPRPPISYPAPPPPHLPNPNPNPNVLTTPNPGARLMALLGTTAPSNLETANSMPPSSALSPASSGDFSVPANSPILQTIPSAPPVSLAAVPQQSPARLPSSKLPRGRHLAAEDRAIYDVDVREAPPPQLEVTPITKYISDPGLVLGRQIAVNRSYICYGLKLGAIRVLNINTALRSLLRGHTQRVSDMAFFAEDVHLLASASVDGRVFVWKINEGPDEEDKPQITGKIVIAIQIVADGESFHPRVCWHTHKQEVLVVGVGNRVLKIDTTKVGRGEVFSAEEPLKCPVEKLIDGIQFVGKHDGEVTDLSMSQWMTTRLVSASKDGTIKIWEDRKATPLVTLRPHDGQPVNSVAFLTSPHRPDHIVLITAGPLNREVKIWVSASQDGWLLPSDSESWKCTQTLGLRSSAEPRVEEAFFNQVVVLPSASLILLANAKKNAIYAVHVDYGLNPASTRMDYIAEFTVTMPILSLTGTSDCFPDGEQVVQVYCVQTQAIQQYALDLSQCLPPPLENVGLEECSISRGFETPSSDGFAMSEPSRGATVGEMPVAIASPKPPLPASSSDSGTTVRYPVSSGDAEMPSIQEFAILNAESKSTAPLSGINADAIQVSAPLVPLSPDMSGRIAGFRSPSKGFERGPSFGDNAVDQPVNDYSVDKRVEGIHSNSPDVRSLDDTSAREELKTGPNDITTVQNPPMFKMGHNTTHLVTPSEILSGAVSSSENTHAIQGIKVVETRLQDVTVNNDVGSVEVEVKVVGESNQHEEFDAQKESRVLESENKENSVGAQTTDSNNEVAKECCALTTDIFSLEEARQVKGVTGSVALEPPSNSAEEVVQNTRTDLPEKVTESVTVTPVAQSPAAKGKKQKTKQSQASGPSSPSPSPFNSSDSLNEQGSSSSVPLTEAAFSQILSMQETLNQLMAMQKEMQKQMSVNVAVPVTKEGRRVEAALGKSMEKSIKANVDALWARFQEENAKHEKLERDRIQQITGLISNCMNKDLPVMLEKSLKKEISAIGPAVARAITPVLEKTISSSIADSFQRGVGDKAVSQLEKSVNSKLEATVARQIQAQFQTSGKQALQEALRSSLELSVIPAFELSCKAMFEQVDATFQKGMNEHTTAAQQQFESTHTSLALTLRDAITSASSITQNLSSELADGQRKILALVAAGNPKAVNPMAMQQNNGPVGGLPEMVEAPLDPMKEMTRLISERKFDEAFTLALQRSDVNIVSWLCSQVDIQGICSMTPLPLSQGVLLALLQQLACDINNDTARKLGWMTDVATAINPADPMIAVHARPIFEQVYQILVHQRSLPTLSPAETSSIRLLIHVINSVLMSC